jgi:hypothetical protein
MRTPKDYLPKAKSMSRRKVENPEPEEMWRIIFKITFSVLTTWAPSLSPESRLRNVISILPMPWSNIYSCILSLLGSRYNQDLQTTHLVFQSLQHTLHLQNTLFIQQTVRHHHGLRQIYSVSRCCCWSGCSSSFILQEGCSSRM